MSGTNNGSGNSSSFKDLKDRTWTIEINVYSVKTVKERLGVNIFTLVDNRYEGLTKLQGDLAKLVDVIFCLCEEQAKAKVVSDEDFGRALAGDALGAANDAFEVALINFFPDRGMRETHRKVRAKAERAKELLILEAEKELESLDDSSLVERLKKIAGDGLELAESTQDRIPGASSP